MNKRYLGAIILAPLLIFLFLGGIYLKLLMFLITLVGMYEFYKVSKEKAIHPLTYIGYIICAIYYCTFDSSLNFKNVSYIVIIAVFILFCVPVFNTKYNFIDIAVTILGFIYIGIFFSFIVLVDNKFIVTSGVVVNIGKYLVWLIFISSWVSDTFAYYTGRYFGKNKLCPKVSPKKTVEGFIGGLLGSIFSCTLYGYLVNTYGINFHFINIEMYHYVIIGVLCGIFSVFGDLAASSIKRTAGVKDYSNLIPGHGGILDRFDSILFAAVVVFYYVTFILGI